MKRVLVIVLGCAFAIVGCAAAQSDEGEEPLDQASSAIKISCSNPTQGETCSRDAGGN